MLREIKASFRNTTDEQKKIFKSSACLLTISVGQETHEDDRFAATMTLIHESFRTCTITLHDSLQRYTIALDSELEADAYYATAITLGDAWLTRNETFYGNSSIIRWDDWLSDPGYADAKRSIVAELDSDPIYKAVFNETINDYLSRYMKRLKDPASFDLERAYRLCFDYLVEECAVLCLWPQSGCKFEIYSGKHNCAMQETHKRFLMPIMPDFQSIRVGFNRRPNLQPQCF